MPESIPGEPSPEETNPPTFDMAFMTSVPVVKPKFNWDTIASAEDDEEDEDGPDPAPSPWESPFKKAVHPAKSVGPKLKLGGVLVCAPDFPGYITLGLDEPMKDGDCLAKPFNNGGPFTHPDEGDYKSPRANIGQVPRKAFSIDESDGWCLYRPTPKTYVKLEPNVKAKEGDILCKYEDGDPAYVNKHGDCDAGFIIDSWAGRTVEDILAEMANDDYEGACLYRVVVGPQQPRRLPGNKNYGKPLPLP